MFIDNTTIGIHIYLVGHWNTQYINVRRFLASSHFDNLSAGTNTFLCDQNKSGQILTIF